MFRRSYGDVIGTLLRAGCHQRTIPIRSKSRTQTAIQILLFPQFILQTLQRNILFYAYPWLLQIYGRVTILRLPLR